jgi:class 3 adenylate cyclase
VVSVVCLLVSIILLAGVLQVERQSVGFNGLAPKAAAVLEALIKEEGEAVRFLVTVPAADTDVYRAIGLLLTNGATTSALATLHSAFEEEFPSYTSDNTISAILLLPRQELLDAQLTVRTRQCSPARAVAIYEGLKMKAFAMLMRYGSLRAPAHLQTRIVAFVSSQLEWLQELYEAVLEAIDDQQVLTSDTLSLLADVRHGWRYTASMLFGFGGISGELQGAILEGMLVDDRVGEYLASIIVYPSNWTLKVEPSTIPASTYTAAYTAAMQVTLSAVKEVTVDRSTNPHLLGIAYGASAVLLLCIVMALVLQHFIQKVIDRDDDIDREASEDALSNAYARMERFVASIWALHVKGSAHGSEARALHPAERELYTLEVPAKSLLRYLHPAASLFRSRLGDSSSPVPRQLISRRLTVVLIDLSCLHQAPTAESLKVMPEAVGALFGGVSTLVEQAGGCLHEVSGDRLIVVWNLTSDCVDSESVACTAVTNIYRTWCTDATPLRFSVVTGDVLAGVVGTPTYKAFTLQGALLQLGVHLLKLNKVHECAAIIDDVTFAALETQSFRAKPIEVVAHADDSKGVAYELVLQSVADRDSRMLHWNEGFEEYKSLALTEATNIFLQYRDLYGGSASLHRILGLLMSDPPRGYVSINEEVSLY